MRIQTNIISNNVKGQSIHLQGWIDKRVSGASCTDSLVKSVGSRFSERFSFSKWKRNFGKLLAGFHSHMYSHAKTPTHLNISYASNRKQSTMKNQSQGRKISLRHLQPKGQKLMATALLRKTFLVLLHAFSLNPPNLREYKGVPVGV